MLARAGWTMIVRAGAGAEIWEETRAAKQGLRKLLDINVVVYGLISTQKLGTQPRSTTEFEEILNRDPSSTDFTADEIMQIRHIAEIHYEPSFINNLIERDPRQKLRLAFLSRLTFTNQNYLLSKRVTNWLTTLAQAPDSDKKKFDTIKALEGFCRRFKPEDFPANEENLLHAFIKNNEVSLLDSFLQSVSESERKEILSKQDSAGNNLISYALVNLPTQYKYKKYSDPDSNCILSLHQYHESPSTIAPLLKSICGGSLSFAAAREITEREESNKSHKIELVSRLFGYILHDAYIDLHKLWLAGGGINKEFILSKVIAYALNDCIYFSFPASLLYLKEAINEADHDIFSYKLGSPSYPILSHIALSRDVAKLHFETAYKALLAINVDSANAALKTVFEDAINANNENVLRYLTSHYSSLLSTFDLRSRYSSLLSIIDPDSTVGEKALPAVTAMMPASAKSAPIVAMGAPQASLVASAQPHSPKDTDEPTAFKEARATLGAAGPDPVTVAAPFASSLTGSAQARAEEPAPQSQIATDTGSRVFPPEEFPTVPVGLVATIPAAASLELPNLEPAT